MATGETRLAGTAFFLSRDIPSTERTHVYAVTAKHVLTGIRGYGIDTVLLRLNYKDGRARWAETLISDWSSHPSDDLADIAVLRAGLSEEMDHLTYPITECATEQIIASHEIGVGEEVFLTGLFTHHHGNIRNIPIVRVGNIAAMPEEQVRSKLGPIDAYLIEARSIGGLSGSPVFAHLGITRYIGGAVKQSSGGPIYFLLGVMQGHWDGGLSATDTTVDAKSEQERVNMGIGIVVPIEKVLETIDQPSVRAADSQMEADLRK